MPGEAQPFTRFVSAFDEVHDHLGSMSAKNREEALQVGLQQKAKEFKKSGAEVYAKA